MVIVGDAFARPMLDALDTDAGRALDVSGCACCCRAARSSRPSLKRALVERLPGVLVVDGYGASETGGQGQSVVVVGRRHPDRAAVPGRPTTRWCSATISGPRRAGVVGRLARRGPIPLGYYKDPEKTAATFPVVDGVRWAVPGDHAVVDADGSITLLGRGSVSINTRRREGLPRRGRVGAEGPRRRVRRGRGRRPRRALGRARRRGRAGARRRRRRRSTRSRHHAREHLAGYKVPREIVLVDAIDALAVGQARLPLGQGDRDRRTRRVRVDVSEPPRGRDQPVPPPARDNPVDWYPVGRRGVRAGPHRRQADLLVGRLLVVPLVSRDGARVVRGPGDRRRHEPALREREGRPRGTPRRRRDLHAGGAGADRPRRLADDACGARPTAARSTAAPTSRTTTATACPSFRGCARSWPRRGASSATTSRSRRPSSPRRSTSTCCRPRATGELDADDPRRPPRATCATQFDRAWGGFGRAPKFPQAMTIDFLCRELVRTGAPETREMITTTLDAMAAGGIHDQLGGGFARYSTDDDWLVPHFEKMLYDNALLTRAYLHGYLVTGERALPRGRRRHRRLRAARPRRSRRRLLLRRGRRLRRRRRQVLPAGRSAEIREVCGDDADEVIRYYGVTDDGNFVDPHTELPRQHPARRRAATSPQPDAVERAQPPHCSTGARTRVRPGRDDKVLLGWNALFLAALTEAAAALDRDDWMEAARDERALPARASCAATDGRFLRSWRAPYLAYAEDYAALLEALLHARRARRRRVARRRARRRRRAAPPLPRRRRRRVLHDRPRRRAARRPARRTSSTTRRRRRTRSPRTGCCASRALTGDDALRRRRRSRSCEMLAGPMTSHPTGFAYLARRARAPRARADRDRDRRRPGRRAHARAARARSPAGSCPRR